MKRLIILLCIIVLLVPAGSSFEDTFQYYPGGDATSNWVVSCSVGSCGITTYGGTYSRVIYYTGSTGAFTHVIGSISNKNLFDSTYVSFNIRAISGSAGGAVFSNIKKLYVYDVDGVVIDTYDLTTGVTGLYEIIKSGSNIALRIEGVDKGTIGTSSKNIGKIALYMDMFGDGGGSINIKMDDFSTNGNIIGIGTESTTHTLTESNLQPTNISWAAYSFPFADFTAADYSISVKRFVNGVYTELTNDEVKTATGTTPLQGMKNYTRDTDFTDSDTSYGLYWAFLQKDGSNIANDYFFLQPPGGTSSISFADANIIIGQSETISYSINSPDYSTYNYHVRVYSSSAQVQSTQVYADSGTVTWDTTGESAGIYFVVLSRTEKADASNYDELAYDTSTLSANILISGYTYDMQNGTALDNVSINFSQGATWYNTTSNATGYYELLNLDVSIPTNVNASKTGWQHENFTFTPLIAQPYEIDLFLLNNTPSWASNGSVMGMVYDYPYHQPVGDALVVLGSNNTTSNATTGFFLFDDRTSNYTDILNATKSGFLNSDDYSINVVNNTYVWQNILMYELYALTITAQDSTTSANIQDFDVLFNSTTYSTTTGSITITNITYGLYTVQVSSDGYYASSQSILMDNDKTDVFTLSQVTSYQNTLQTAPHMVQFIFMDNTGERYEGITLTALGYNSTTGGTTWDWLKGLIGIDADLYPIHNTSMTGISGSDGSISFMMVETIYYKLNYTYNGNAKTYWLYPKNDLYYFWLPTTDSNWDTYDVNVRDALYTNVTKSIINSTHAYINVTYLDNQNTTSNLTIYLNQTNNSDPINQTNLQLFQANATNSTNTSFIVSNYGGQTYLIKSVVVSTTYGTQTRTYSVFFEDEWAFDGVPESVIFIMAFLIMLFTAAVFTGSTAEIGALVTCGLGWIFYFGSAFDIYIPDLQMGLALTLATIVSIFAYIKNSRDKDRVV